MHHDSLCACFCVRGHRIAAVFPNKLSSTQNVWKELRGEYGRIQEGIFLFVFEVQHTHGKLSYQMFNELSQT